jgi:Co/Zn/Cd efflux system component
LVALAKAGFMAIGGLGVIAGATLIFFNPIGLPAMGIMGIVGGVALLANVTCAALLYRHRKDNINMKSSWKGIRNDAASNAGVLLAAGLGHLFVSPIPDLVVGVVVSGLCIYSAAEIALEARRILRRPENAKKKKPRKQAPPKRPQPKIVLGFKKLLRSVFNRKAAKAGAKQQTPVAAAPQATPAPEPVVNKPAIKPVQPETALPAPA